MGYFCGSGQVLRPIAICFFIVIFQWDFQGPPRMGPCYGKLPILFPLLGVPGITLEYLLSYSNYFYTRQIYMKI